MAVRKFLSECQSGIGFLILRGEQVEEGQTMRCPVPVRRATRIGPQPAWSGCCLTAGTLWTLRWYDHPMGTEDTCRAHSSLRGLRLSSSAYLFWAGLTKGTFFCFVLFYI